MPGTPGVVVVYWLGRDLQEKFMGLTQALADPRNGDIIGGQILFSEQQLGGDGAIQARVESALFGRAPGPAAPALDPRARALAAQAYTAEPLDPGAHAPPADVR